MSTSPTNRSSTVPRDSDYEWEYYDEPVSFEGLKAHRYSIVIGFWVGLAVFVLFMFFVLTLLTKTGAPHPDINRLQSIGITDTALSWFNSYLSGRSHYININNHTSSTTPVRHGVPQGSVLGPVLFILYILPLGHIIHCHGLNFHCYADDTQLYINTKTITPEILSTLTNCITDIKTWMSKNFLKLNSNKTEIIIFGPKSMLHTSQNFSLSIDGHSVTPTALVRNLGLYMDPALSFKPHINHITKTSFFHLRNIARLRPTLLPSVEPWEKRVRLASCGEDLDGPRDHHGNQPCGPRALPDESRLLFHCYINEDEHATNRRANPTTGTCLAGARGDASCSATNSQSACAVQEALAHFNIPNFVNSELSSTLGDDDLLLGDPPLILDTEGRGSHATSCNQMLD
ncbi:hypothetical protein ACEWY4_020524 [Coilia grayii]|uniref:Reverse transcriptase domain-containing protein n=1 Tax=Coilia grayii TaxID=363190 RepID=A0ABD1JE46_9TELE